MPLSTAMPPVAAREGMIPCQPTAPCLTPGICWILLGSRRTAFLMETPSEVMVDPADVAAVASAGCGTAASVVPGEEHVPVPSGGTERTVIRHVPPAHDGATPMPVVVDFHGYSEGGDIHALHSAVGPFGDEQGFVTITPDSGAYGARWDTEPGSADPRVR